MSSSPDTAEIVKNRGDSPSPIQGARYASLLETCRGTCNSSASVYTPQSATMSWQSSRSYDAPLGWGLWPHRRDGVNILWRAVDEICFPISKIIFPLMSEPYCVSRVETLLTPARRCWHYTQTKVDDHQMVISHLSGFVHPEVISLFYNWLQSGRSD